MQKPKYEAQIPDAASLSSRKSATATDQWLRRRQCVDLWFDMPAKRSPSTLSSSEVKDGEGGSCRDEMSDRETKASLKCLAVCTVPDILKIKELSQNPSTRCSHSSRESSVPTRPSSRDSRGFCDSCSPEWFTTQRRCGDKNTQIYLDYIRDDLPSRTTKNKKIFVRSMPAKLCLGLDSCSKERDTPSWKKHCCSPGLEIIEGSAWWTSCGGGFHKMSSDNKDSCQLLDNTVRCRAGISLPAVPKRPNL